MNAETRGAVVAVLGKGAVRDLLDAITRTRRNELRIERLSQHDDATWLAEFLIEIETNPDDIKRLRLIDGLRGQLEG